MDFQTLVGKAMSDEKFAQALADNPEQALKAAGITPTPEMLEASREWMRRRSADWLRPSAITRLLRCRPGRRLHGDASRASGQQVERHLSRARVTF